MRPLEPGAAERFVAGLGPGVHRAPTFSTAESLRAALGSSGWATFVVDLGGASDKAGIIDSFATGLDFPGWVGRNWDALQDALRDLSWLPPGDHGRALLLLGAEQPSAGPRAELDVLGDVLRESVASVAESSSPLVVVITA